MRWFNAANNNYNQTPGFPVDANGNTANSRDYRGNASYRQTTERHGENYNENAIQDRVVVSKDGVVLSGNGRTMAGELAARHNTDKEYIDYLREHAEDFGFTKEQVDSMEHPRVLFEVQEDLPYTAETFDMFNKGKEKVENKTETAVRLGKTTPPETISKVLEIIDQFDNIGEFNNNNQAPIDVLRELASAGVITQNEINALMENGKLSPQGKDFIENLLVGNIFAGDPDAVRILSNNPDVRQKVVTGLSALTSNARLGDGFSLVDEITTAIKLIANEREGNLERGSAVQAITTSFDFGEDYGSTPTEAFTNQLVITLTEMLNGKRVREFKEFLDSYNNEAEVSAGGETRMFGNLGTKEEIFNFIIDNFKNGRYKKSRDARAGQGEAERAGDEETGPGAQNPRADEGQEVGGEGDTRFRDGEGDAGVAEPEEPIKPIGTGPFGEIYDQFKGKAKDAIAFLLKKKSGEAIGALYHKDIGDIDLVWGKEGSGKSDGYGLAKLAKYHPEVLDNLQEILDDMRVADRTDNRVQLESETHQAAVRLTWDNNKKSWLLTAFEKKNSAFDNTTDTGETENIGKQNDTATLQNTVSNDKGTTVSSNVQENGEKTTERGELYRDGEVSEREMRRDSEESKRLFDATKEKFGTTNDLREAGYILPDGTMLDFSGRYMVDEGNDTSHLRGRRAVDHRAIHEVGYDKDENETGFSTNMQDFVGRGAIRIDANAGSINLSMPPTPEQARVLQQLIARNGGDVTVDYGDGYNNEHYAEYESARATRVLGDIDRYFNEGIKPEGNLRYRQQEPMGERGVKKVTQVRAPEYREGTDYFGRPMTHRVRPGQYKVEGYDDIFNSVEEVADFMQKKNPDYCVYIDEDGNIGYEAWSNILPEGMKPNTYAKILASNGGKLSSAMKKRIERYTQREMKQARVRAEEITKELGLDVEFHDDPSEFSGRKSRAKGWYDPKTYLYYTERYEKTPQLAM